ncbi:hypothetical protein [Sporosarcina sp. OR05]|uniref:hypothetical protein n=1 Tax=Sporosarcina sp. OR05 TaxID=2969819 RepID=UPI00352AEE16
MTISFHSHEEFFTFHDPLQNGDLIDRKTEIRFDPLTGESSRIIYDMGAPFVPKDYAELAKLTEGEKCPFCTPNVLTSTPRFPDELVEGGRFIHDQAVVFPNLFPYSKHNAVVRMADQHYVTLEQFTTDLITNACKAAHQYIENIVEFDPQTKYVSVNWNYMPPSGGSIVHPHLHVLASEQPTNYQAVITEKSKEYYAKNGENYYLALAEKEQSLGERWIGETGTIRWVHAYAPKSHMDFIGMTKAASLQHLTDEDYENLADGLLRFFTYFTAVGIGSFNLALCIPIQASEAETVHLRLLPRMTVGMLESSDCNVFNYLHAEPLSLKVPEQVTKEVQRFFIEGK